MADANCTDMINLSSSTSLKISLSFNLVVSMTAFPLLLWANYQLWMMPFAKLFHVNIKILIQLHLLGFIIHCCGRITLHSLDLHNYLLLDNPCYMIPNIYRCFIFRLMYNIGIWVTGCSAIFLTIERWIATWKSLNYENCSPLIGVLLSLLQCILAAIPLSFAYSNTKFDGVYMPYCSVYKPSFPRVAKFNAIAVIVAQLFSRIAFGRLYNWNFRERTTNLESSLSKRFQLEQNMQSMYCLKVNANLCSVFTFLQSGSFLLLIHVAATLPSHTYLTLMEYNSGYPLFAIITILVMSKTITHIRGKVRTGLATNMTTDKSLYFEIFKKQLL
ncbi:unnamed protein product [Caenorhabditis bovis]|uniref:Serpentine Receptor, class AB (Class A-like) n=1 Tax=Caenorhabditis bovis TaxID=2654633 RepID=A0A8S1E8Q0_9PELO|nr:unnamed protein product [Caenorhabditis bovis]